MSMNEDDLFGIDDENNDILAHLNDDALHEKSYWPRDLVELSQVIQAQLRREGIAEGDEQYRLMDRLLLAMSFMAGGRGFYLPQGDRIKKALLYKRIYDQFDGHNHLELGKKYKLSEQRIYQIIREQRQLHRQRLQPGLFPDG